jgi:hypothetical protein
MLTKTRRFSGYPVAVRCARRILSALTAKHTPLGRVVHAIAPLSAALVWWDIRAAYLVKDGGGQKLGYFITRSLLDSQDAHQRRGEAYCG